MDRDITLNKKTQATMNTVLLVKGVLKCSGLKWNYSQIGQAQYMLKLREVYYDTSTRAKRAGKAYYCQLVPRIRES